MDQEGMLYNGVTVEDNGKMYILKVEFHRSMNDEKMQKLLLGRGGGFCVLCPFSADEAVSLDQIKDGFEIGNVDIETLNALYENLADDDKGVKNPSRGLQEQNGTNPESNLCIQCCYIPYIACIANGFRLLSKSSL